MISSSAHIINGLKKNMKVNNEKITAFLPLNEILYVGEEYFIKEELNKIFYWKTIK